MQKVSKAIDPETKKNIVAWLSGNYDEKTKEEIKRLGDENPGELIDAFYTRLAFGTGGLRGIMGAGSNRMNIYTVRGATQGLANYIKKEIPKDKRSVVVGYDSRHMSKEFALETAKVLAANEIKVFLYKEIRPVPFVSFALLQKKCAAGVMITASHNPPKYNGYKVYWSYGGQVLPPHDQGIIDEVEKISDFSNIKTASFPNSYIEMIGEEMDRAYIDAVRSLMQYPGDNKSKGKQLQIVYTPLFGSGYAIVPKALYDWGFSNLTLVESQATPNGDFPGLKAPNPEYIEVLKLGIQSLKEVKGDILIGTDADADRIGVVVHHKGEYIPLNGNEVACLAVEHLCRALKENHATPPKPVFMKTIVTSELVRAIAEHYKATCLDVLTGFKYIGEKIHIWEEEKKESATAHVPYHHYIFGGEESYGYLLGTHVRDKDAIISANLVAEMALHQKLQGKTLIDLLYEIYKQYGVYREKLASLTYEGKEGQEKIEAMMKKLRSSPPKEINGIKVEIAEDYLTHSSFHLTSGHKEPILLPKSDVLRFWLEDETKIVVRPSGTEPKIKLYCGVHKKAAYQDMENLKKRIEAADKACDGMLEAVKKILS